MLLIKYLKDFLQLVLPNCCVVCHVGLVTGEKSICISCLSSMPLTNFWNMPNNPLLDLMRTRNGCSLAMAYSYFTKRGPIKKVLHGIKYKGHEQLGVHIGHMFGQLLAYSEYASQLDKFDLLIPVPISRSRRKSRGYNQSELIAKGLNSSLSLEYRPDLLQRRGSVKSLTTKSKSERFKALDGLFYCPKPKELLNKAVILVDDVYTTGSTANHCIDELRKGGIREIGFVCLAFNANY